MDERDWADHFSHDVDDLLNQAGQSDVEPRLGEYRQVLELARTLTATDLSGDSRIRQALRRRLLDQVDAREAWRLRKEIPMRTFFWQRYAVLSLMTIVLVVLAVITLAWPGTLTAATQGIRDIVQSLSLGPNTTIAQVNSNQPASTTRTSPPTTPVIARQGDLWIVRTAIGNFGGNVLPGHDATVRQVRSFNEAQASASFKLSQPGYLPTGYSFREAMVTPLEWVLIFYDGPNGDIILVEMPVGERPGGDAGHVTSVGVGLLTDKPIESVTLNGQQAGWIEGHGLMWETDGVSYTVGGSNLTLEQATRIAESLK